MSHQNTVFHQLLKPILRQDFERLAKQQHQGQKLRSATRWDQFIAILMSQLSCRQSLRDIESNLESQQEKLYHLGAKRTARSTLARINEEQPASLYQQLFIQLLQHCENSKIAQGWDVTNLYTIIPLRAANARTLVEQSIGRGLRLPYGKRTGVEEVDRLSIVAHDRFQEIVDGANKSDSIIKLKTLILEPENEEQGVVSVTSTSRLDVLLGTGHSQKTDIRQTETIQDQVHQNESGSIAQTQKVSLDLTDPTVIAAIKHVQKEIQSQAKNIGIVKHSEDLKRQEVQEQLTANVLKAIQENVATIVQELDFGEIVTSKSTPSEAELKNIVEQVTELHIQNTIDIPRISMTPSDDVTTGYSHFTLNTQGLHLQPQERELLGHNLRDNSVFSIKAEEVSQEKTPQDQIVYALIDFDYFTQSELLYDLANQMVDYFKTYLTDDEVVQVVEQNYQTIANNMY